MRELLDNPEATVVINERDPVLVSSSVLDWELMDILMDELQGLCGSVGGEFGNRASVMLAS